MIFGADLHHIRRLMTVVAIGVLLVCVAAAAMGQSPPSPTPSPELVHYGDLIDETQICWPPAGGSCGSAGGGFAMTEMRSSIGFVAPAR